MTGPAPLFTPDPVATDELRAALTAVPGPVPVTAEERAEKRALSGQSGECVIELADGRTVTAKFTNARLLRVEEAFDSLEGLGTMFEKRPVRVASTLLSIGMGDGTAKVVQCAEMLDGTDMLATAKTLVGAVMAAYGLDLAKKDGPGEDRAPDGGL